MEKPIAKTVDSDIIKLPKYQEALIPRAKFTEYALNPSKDANKAEAFRKALGYTLENVDDLIEQIYAKLPEYNAVKKGDRGWGMTYEVIVDITGPNGKTAKVLTAWIDDKSNGEMRLTTVHVDKQGDDFVIELYERYRLKDGRTGRAVDILGDGEACIFEIDKQGIEDRVITVTEDEIKEKVL